MKSNNLLRNCIVAILFSILFVPLVFFENTFFPYITGKNFVFRILVEAAALTAKEKGKEGSWVFTLDYPSFVPFITYVDNRKLRQEMFMASASLGANGNEWNNLETVKKIVRLRHQRANLLGS